jgi:hypothetical protein
VASSAAKLAATDTVTCHVVSRFDCTAAPQHRKQLNQHCAPMPSETTRPSSRESPSACGPIVGGDAAPGSRFQDRTKAPRRDSGLPSGQRHAEKCRAKNHAANGQGVAKRDRRAHSRSNKLLGAGSAPAPSQRHLWVRLGHYSLRRGQPASQASCWTQANPTVPGAAAVGLTNGDRTPLHTMESAENGEFEFMNILPGSYRVLVNAKGFVPFASAAFVVTE